MHLNTHTRNRLAMRIGLLAMVASMVSACASTGTVAQRPASQQRPTQQQPSQQPGPPVYIPAAVQTAPQYPASSYRNAIGPELDAQIYEAWRSFPGKTGIAVERIDGSGVVGRRLDDFFPQQSVSKLWVALAVFDAVDRGMLSLNQQVRIDYNDFTMFQSVVKARAETNGSTTESVANLLELAITKSDNTANDKLMWVVGGPDAVRRTLADKGITGIRFGPGERALQSSIAGFQWEQRFGPGNTWFNERNKIPDATRRSALNRYLADPIDGATPRGMVAALAKLARGELLTPASTRQLIGIMARTTSGPNRLKAGVPTYWNFAHKTATGQTFAGISTGYNDVGIMTAPDGTRYAVAVMIADTTASIPARMQMMQSISREVARLHDQ